VQRDLKWWQWLLIGAGFCGIAIIMVRLRYVNFSFTGLIVVLVAWTCCTVCWIVAAMRFAKWLWVAAKARAK
jgi:hypothetical protein